MEPKPIRNLQQHVNEAYQRWCDQVESSELAVSNYMAFRDGYLMGSAETKVKALEDLASIVERAKDINGDSDDYYSFF